MIDFATVEKSYSDYHGKNEDDLRKENDEIANQRLTKNTLVAFPLSMSGRFFEALISSPTTLLLALSKISNYFFTSSSNSFNLPTPDISYRNISKSDMTSTPGGQQLQYASADEYLKKHPSVFLSSKSTLYHPNPLTSLFFIIDYIMKNVGKFLGWALVSVFTIPVHFLIKAYYAIKIYFLDTTEADNLWNQYATQLGQIDPKTLAEGWLKRTAIPTSVQLLLAPLPPEHIAGAVSISIFYDAVMARIAAITTLPENTQDGWYTTPIWPTPSRETQATRLAADIERYLEACSERDDEDTDDCFFANLWLIKSTLTPGEETSASVYETACKTMKATRNGEPVQEKRDLQNAALLFFLSIRPGSKEFEGATLQVKEILKTQGIDCEATPYAVTSHSAVPQNQQEEKREDSLRQMQELSGRRESKGDGDIELESEEDLAIEYDGQNMSMSSFHEAVIRKITVITTPPRDNSPGWFTAPNLIGASCVSGTLSRRQKVTELAKYIDGYYKAYFEAHGDRQTKTLPISHEQDKANYTNFTAISTYFRPRNPGEEEPHPHALYQYAVNIMTMIEQDSDEEQSTETLNEMRRIALLYFLSVPESAADFREAQSQANKIIQRTWAQELARYPREIWNDSGMEEVGEQTARPVSPSTPSLATLLTRGKRPWSQLPQDDVEDDSLHNSDSLTT